MNYFGFSFNEAVSALYTYAGGGIVLGAVLMLCRFILDFVEREA